MQRRDDRVDLGGPGLVHQRRQLLVGRRLKSRVAVHHLRPRPRRHPHPNRLLPDRYIGRHENHRAAGARQCVGQFLALRQLTGRHRPPGELQHQQQAQPGGQRIAPRPARASPAPDTVHPHRRQQRDAHHRRHRKARRHPQRPELREGFKEELVRQRGPGQVSAPAQFWAQRQHHAHHRQHGAAGHHPAQSRLADGVIDPRRGQRQRHDHGQSQPGYPGAPPRPSDRSHPPLVKQRLAQIFGQSGRVLLNFADVARDLPVAFKLAIAGDDRQQR